MSIKNEGEGLYIPQQDGASDDIKPSAFAPHGKVSDVICVGLLWRKCYPFLLNDDVDDDDESLNEDDDYEEDDINDDEDIPHLIMCQFDYVRFISSLLLQILKL